MICGLFPIQFFNDDKTRDLCPLIFCCCCSRKDNMSECVVCAKNLWQNTKRAVCTFNVFFIIYLFCDVNDANGIPIFFFSLLFNRVCSVIRVFLLFYFHCCCSIGFIDVGIRYIFSHSVDCGFRVIRLYFLHIKLTHFFTLSTDSTSFHWLWFLEYDFHD